MNFRTRRRPDDVELNFVPLDRRAWSVLLIFLIGHHQLQSSWDS